MIENKEFNDYISEFKKLPIQKKKDMTLYEVKRIIGILEKINLDFYLDKGILYNREILDAKGNISEEDFVEAIFVYIHSVQESLAKYLEFTTELLYEEE